jgi:hypothetical protein
VKPGVASVQAALLSCENFIIVVRKDNPVFFTGKADGMAEPEGKSPGDAKASRGDTTAVRERGMYVQG